MTQISRAISTTKTFAFNALVRTSLTTKADRNTKSNESWKAGGIKVGAYAISFFSHCLGYLALFSFSSNIIELARSTYSSTVFSNLFTSQSKIALVIGGLITLVGFILRGIRNTDPLNIDLEISKITEEQEKIVKNYRKILKKNNIKEEQIFLAHKDLAQSTKTLLGSIELALRSPRLTQNSKEILQNQKQLTELLLLGLTLCAIDAIPSKIDPILAFYMSKPQSKVNLTSQELETLIISAEAVINYQPIFITNIPVILYGKIKTPNQILKQFNNMAIDTKLYLARVSQALRQISCKSQGSHKANLEDIRIKLERLQKTQTNTRVQIENLLRNFSKMTKELAEE